MVIYNYITTNKINNKQYVGMHSTDEVDDGYLGSGALLLKAIKKYGKQSFTREILTFCIDVSVAHYNEGIYIVEYNTLAPYGYNISPTGGIHKGGRTTFSEDHKNNISKALLGNPSPRKGVKLTLETKEKISKSQIGRKSPRKGVKLTLETKEKISNSKLGIPINRVKPSSRKGKKLSEGHVENIKASYINGRKAWNKGLKYKINK